MGKSYTHDEELILDNLINFELADDDFDPICLKGKYWEFIKEDIVDTVKANYIDFYLKFTQKILSF